MVSLDNTDGSRALTVESVELQDPRDLRITAAYITPIDAAQSIMNGAPLDPSQEWVRSSMPLGDAAVVPPGTMWVLVQVVRAPRSGGSADQSIVRYEVEGSAHAAYTHTGIEVAPAGAACS